MNVICDEGIGMTVTYRREMMHDLLYIEFIWIFLLVNRKRRDEHDRSRVRHNTW